MMLYAPDFLIFNHMKRRSHTVFHVANSALQMVVYMRRAAA
tara:strand:+ start:407 stop:529 length:123 start_codon:yes stop_codon:yes gene_type:complete